MKCILFILKGLKSKKTRNADCQIHTTHIYGIKKKIITVLQTSLPSLE